MRTFATLLTLASAAAPSVLAAKAYIPYAWNNTAPEIHMKPVAAHAGDFWIGLPTTAKCPNYDTHCPSRNITIISGPTPSRHDPTHNASMWMGILNAKGQEMYVTKNGAFGYTLPNTTLAIPSGRAINATFAIELDGFSNQTVLRYNGNDFVGCPVDGFGPSRYNVRPLSFGSEVYKFQQGSCLPFKMMVVETTAPAVEFYEY